MATVIEKVNVPVDAVQAQALAQHHHHHQPAQAQRFGAKLVITHNAESVTNSSSDANG